MGGLAWSLGVPFFHTTVFYLWVNGALWAVSAVYAEETRAGPVAGTFFVCALITTFAPTASFLIDGLLLGGAFWWLGRKLSQLAPTGTG